ncbi:hypothetical protein [Bacillus sp. EB600]|uniref:hypothetical protein n=1 Tax=Bacillus sp. EB600 TaxID=2806345 RepID=UPI0021093133|nr:hypothetical protein [Bacillus sp. EB600]MCQ6279469.1 hypothetical protein [Bacillus sp. EB600]
MKNFINVDKEIAALYSIDAVKKWTDVFSGKCLSSLDALQAEFASGEPRETWQEPYCCI